MREIQGKAKTIRELLKGVKYAIDYYQREYKWQEKQIQELINDLTTKFLDDYDDTHARNKVAEYTPYFLGSIIISRKDAANYLVDGQQRLTSLTLLLTHLRHLQNERDTVKVNVDELIASEQYGQQSFNVDVPERTPIMQALFSGQSFDVTEQSESVQNLSQRYQDIVGQFPEEIDQQALPYFIDWMLEKVYLVEIIAFSDDDAYTIFETMNDRGLSLSPTDMLKGYLLANVTDNGKRTELNTLWRKQVQTLTEVGKETDADFFKTWLRSQYANKIRERRRGAKAEEFDRIGTEFHRWLREQKDAIGLAQTADFEQFIERDLQFYAKHYLRLLTASRQLTPGLEAVYYNAQLGFTLQYMVLLAPIKPSDSTDVIDQKLRLVATYINILLARRIWNGRSIVYSTMQYTMFLIMRDSRGLDTDELAQKLHNDLRHEPGFAANDRLQLHQRNRFMLHQLLARLTDFVQTQTGEPSRYVEFANGGNMKYEIEHIWANHPERHTDEFSHPADFAEHRNRVGGLLLLPKSFNASYGDLPYDQKLPHYNTQNNNLLARSLHPQAYDHNPAFKQFVNNSGLPFTAQTEFTRDVLAQRSQLYQQLAERIWNPQTLLNDLDA